MPDAVGYGGYKEGVTMKVNHIFMMGILGGVSLPTTRLIAGGDGNEQAIASSPGYHKKRLSQLFHRSSSSLMSGSSDASSHRNSMVVGSLDSIDSNGSSSSSLPASTSKIKAFKKIFSRSSRRLSGSSSSSSFSPMQRYALSKQADLVAMEDKEFFAFEQLMRETTTYEEVIDQVEHALLSLTRSVPEMFFDGDAEVSPIGCSDIKKMNEINGFIARLETILYKLNAYYKRAEPHFAVSYIKTLSINFAKVSKERINPWDMYKYLAGIYPHLGVSLEDGIQLSCADCRALIEKREKEHSREKDFLRQAEWAFRNGIAKQEFDTLLQEGVQGLMRLKINAQEEMYYLHLIKFTNLMRNKLNEFKRSNPSSIKSPDLSAQAFVLEDAKN